MTAATAHGHPTSPTNSTTPSPSSPAKPAVLPLTTSTAMRPATSTTRALPPLAARPEPATRPALQPSPVALRNWENTLAAHIKEAQQDQRRLQQARRATLVYAVAGWLLMIVTGTGAVALSLATPLL